jgi:hypothetical protein
LETKFSFKGSVPSEPEASCSPAQQNKSKNSRKKKPERLTIGRKSDDVDGFFVSIDAGQKLDVSQSFFAQVDFPNLQIFFFFFVPTQQKEKTETNNATHPDIVIGSSSGKTSRLVEIH